MHPLACSPGGARGWKAKREIEELGGNALVLPTDVADAGQSRRQPSGGEAIWPDRHLGEQRDAPAHGSSKHERHFNTCWADRSRITGNSNKLRRRVAALV